jgi:hypothetical protein
MKLSITLPKLVALLTLMVFGLVALGDEPLPGVYVAPFSFWSFVADHWTLVLLFVSEFLAIFSTKYSGLLKLSWLLIRRAAHLIKSRLK